MNRVRRRALLVALVLLAASLGSVFASAPPATAADPQFSLLDQQPAWVNLGGDVLLRLDVPAALLPENEPVTLRLRIHQAVTSSDTFDRTVDGDRLGNRIDQTYSFDLQRLYRDEQGAVLVAFGLAGSTREPALNIRAPGVYPLEVALRTDETLASFVTWIVVADPAATVPPVRLATIWNVTSAPVRDATGAPDRKVVAELSPGGRLDDVATRARRRRLDAPHRPGRSRDARVVERAVAERRAARARSRTTSRARSRARPRQLLPRRTSRSISPRSRRPGSGRSSPTSCAPAPKCSSN